MKTLVGFEASFANDAQVDNKGNIRAPAGRGICEWMATRFVAQGYRCSTPRQHSFYGWSFEVQHRSGAIWFLLQQPGPWLLISESRASFFRKFMGAAGDRAHHEELLRMLEGFLLADKRFSSIARYSREEYDAMEGT